jgi:hypothetical protein
LTVVLGTLLTAPAFAGDSKNTAERGKRESGGEGGAREGGGDSSGGGNEAVLREERRLLTDEKPWQVELDVEGHHLWRQNDLMGSAADKNLMFYGLYGRYQITELDQVQAYLGLYERFLADPGETGMRLDDGYLGYTRLVPLPEDLELRLNGRLTFPLSFASQKAGLITEPSIGARLTRVFFGDLVANIRTRARYDAMKYYTAEGGNPNQKFQWSLSIDGEYTIPYYTPVSVGAELYTSYHWYYSNTTLGPPGQSSGAVTDSQFGTTPPMTQTYGGDIFVRYTFPEWEGIRPDFELAFADGDPTIGYDGRLHDGTTHTYLAFRRTAEVFGVLTVLY